MLKLNDLYEEKVKKLEEENYQRIIEKQTRVSGPVAKLDTDLMKGFKRAVDGSQTRLALEYLLEIITAQNAQIAELQEALEANTAKPAAKKEEASK